MTSSLKRQLLLWLLLPMLIITPVAASLQYWLVLSPAKLEFDHQLGDFAIAIASFLKAKDNKLRFEMTAETEHLLRTDQLDKEFFLVVGPSGEIIAGDALLDTPEKEVQAGEFRYVDRKINKRVLRMVVYGVPCGQHVCQIRIAETLVKRNKVQAQALITTLISILILSLTTMGVMLVAVQHGLKPLQDIRNQLAQRSFDDMRALELPHAPSELKPLISTLNQLFKRLDEASTVQKAFLADAAHQLRTPLTALQTESELALLEPHPASLHPTLERLHHSACRAGKLANQFLMIARADNDQNSVKYSRIDLKEIGARAANEWSRRAFSSGIDLGFQLESAVVKGQPVLLQELLSNLIHNSIEHAGNGTRVTVRTHVLERKAILSVEDDGPGIEEGDRQKVLQRFFRGGHAKGFGSGLGLAIVNDIARIHNAKVTLTTGNNDKGLLVCVAFDCTA